MIPEINLESIFFWYLGMAMIFSSLLAIIVRNPVHTLLFVLVMLVHQALLFLLLGSEFLMVVQIIIYAGAVVVLFLFVVYLINLRSEKMKSIFIRRMLLGGVIFGVFGMFLLLNFYLFLGTHFYQRGGLYFNLNERADIWWIAHYLFNYYLLPFEILGVILLVVILGVVFILRKVRVESEG